ncbi:hypothetical protein EJ08DRAFT_696171 [Tothia fuscella]|uniref:Uncharacterized protein n=1 Tax=Tothia fuscella TaxID=1048955 RepID=A0A9P4TYR3_9PEZI|nr:hypothetical protein EJ08DRAFT_696171 [Tothia fuscella]
MIPHNDSYADMEHTDFKPFTHISSDSPPDAQIHDQPSEMATEALSPPTMVIDCTDAERGDIRALLETQCHSEHSLSSAAGSGTSPQIQAHQATLSPTMPSSSPFLPTPATSIRSTYFTPLNFPHASPASALTAASARSRNSNITSPNSDTLVSFGHPLHDSGSQGYAFSPYQDTSSSLPLSSPCIRLALNTEEFSGLLRGLSLSESTALANSPKAPEEQRFTHSQSLIDFPSFGEQSPSAEEPMADASTPSTTNLFRLVRFSTTARSPLIPPQRPQGPVHTHSWPAIQDHQFIASTRNRAFSDSVQESPRRPRSPLTPIRQAELEELMLNNIHNFLATSTDEKRSGLMDRVYGILKDNGFDKDVEDVEDQDSEVGKTNRAN